MPRNQSGRPAGPEVRTQSADLQAGGSPYVTSSALYENLRFVLPSATANPNGWYQITHVGPRITTVVDASGFRFDFGTNGQVVVFESDGTAWAITNSSLQAEQIRIWDHERLEVRLAKSQQDSLDQIHKLLDSIVTVMIEQGINTSDALEAFHGYIER